MLTDGASDQIGQHFQPTLVPGHTHTHTHLDIPNQSDLRKHEPTAGHVDGEAGDLR